MINLYKDDGNDVLEVTDFLTSTTTDSNGDYTFGDLGPGTYWACEDLPTGWIQTFPSAAGGEVIAACDVVGDAEFGYLFTASSGQDEIGNDFGNFELIDKTGTKYEDSDGDGDITGESGIENWTIYLYNDDGSVPGALDATDTLEDTEATDSNGDYTFGDLAPGDYIVCEDLPTGWVQTFPSTAGGEVIDTCDEGGHAEFGYAFSASSGDDETLNDFANFELIDKTGTKYEDLNGDGDLTDGVAIEGWTIYLYDDVGSVPGDLDATDTLNTSTTTDASGNYTFGDLGPGDYIVCEDLPTGWMQTFPSAAGGEVIDTCDEGGHAEFGYAFSASSGEDETGNDFGNVEVITKSGTKYEDLNGDGDLTDGVPAAGWTINLYADDGATCRGARCDRHVARR